LFKTRKSSQRLPVKVMKLLLTRLSRFGTEIQWSQGRV